MQNVDFMLYDWQVRMFLHYKPTRIRCANSTHGCWLQCSFSKVSMLVSTSLSRHNRVSGLDSGSLGEYLYERTHTATRVLLLLLSYLTNGEFFPLYFSHRIALSSLCWETKAKTGQWTLPRFLPEIRGDGRLVKLACEKRKWEDVDVNPYEAEKKKNRFTCKNSLKTRVY